LRDELLAASHVLAFKCEECRNISGGISILERVQKLLQEDGPSLPLVLTLDSLARLRFFQGSLHVAIGLSRSAAAMLVNASDDVGAVRRYRLQAFKRLGKVVGVDLESMERHANFGAGCFKEWRLQGSFFRRLELSGVAFTIDDMISPRPQHAKDRDACRKAGFRYASMQLDLFQVAARQSGSLLAELIAAVSRMGSSFLQTGMSMCLPFACVIDKEGLSVAAMEFVFLSFLNRFPTEVVQPLWGPEFKVTFDPSGAVSSWGDGSMR